MKVLLTFLFVRQFVFLFFFFVGSFVVVCACDFIEIVLNPN